MTKAMLGWVVVALLLVGLGINHFAERRGYDNGRQAAQSEYTAQLARDQSLTLTTIYEEMKRGASVNTEVRTTLASLAQQQQASTRDLKNALDPANRPVVCRFDVGVMRHLESSADRADDLASGGLRAAGRAGGQMPARDQTD